MKKMKLLFIIIIVPGLLLSACGGAAGSAATATPVASANTVIAEGHLAPSRNQYLAFQAHGKVDQILVRKGDQVKQGQLLASLGDRLPAQAALAAAQLAVISAQQTYYNLGRSAGLGRAQAWQAYLDAQKVAQAGQLALDQLSQSPIQTNIDNAQTDVNSRKSELENAQTGYVLNAYLPNAAQTILNYELKIRTAQTNYDLAVQKLQDLTKARDQLALAQVQLDNANAQVAAAQAALDGYDLKAPFDCTIMDINISSNQMVGPETWAVAIADTSQWYVDTSDLNELDVVKVSLGQKVNISADALPGVKMSGVVEEIGNTPVNQGTDVLYTVHILLNNPDPRLRWGMTMEVTFPVNK